MLDPDEVSKVVSLVNARRAALTVIGLDSVEKDTLDLHSYIAQRDAEHAKPARATNGADTIADSVETVAQSATCEAEGDDDA